MNATNKRLVVRMLRDAADKISNETCGLSDEEMIEIAKSFTHRQMNIEQTCQHFGISRATLNRWQECGKLPEFRKDSGGKCYLYEDEADECVKMYEENIAHH